MPEITIVIVNFNGKHFLMDCLSSLFKQTYTDFEIILVDNCSNDGSEEFVREYFPEVIILRNSQNLGFTGGVNKGVIIAQGDYILTLNNDTTADPKFIEHLIKPMLIDPEVGICAAKMLFMDGRINSTGICFSRSGAAWDRGMYETDIGQYDIQEEVFGACAGAALYRKKMLNEIGLFDEDFFLYMDDYDLSFRARLAGWKCVYVPSSKVWHIHAGTAGVGTDIAVYYGNRNNLWVVFKNFPLWLLLLSTPWIIGRNVAVIPYYASKGMMKIILKSKIDAVIGIVRMFKKRKYNVNSISESEVNKWILLWAKFYKKSSK